MHDYDRFDAMDFACDRHMEEALRIQTGSYYTPYAVAKWMVHTTLNHTFHIEDLSKLSPEALKALAEKLLTLRVLEPASGSGAFVCAFLAYCERVLVLAGGTAAFQDHLPRLLHQVFPCDIQMGPLKAYQDIISQTYQVTQSSIPIYCCDMLDTDQVNAHPQLAQQIQEGFDFVFGNPPYLGEKSNKDLFSGIRQTSFGQSYYEGKMDLFYFFAYRGILSLKPHGVMTFLTTNYFPTADGANGFRAFLKDQGHFTWIVNLANCQLFSDALGQNNMIWSYQQTPVTDADPKPPLIIAHARHSKSDLGTLQLVAGESFNNPDHWHLNVLSQPRVFDQHNHIQLYCSDEVLTVLDEIEQGAMGMLGDFFEVNQGIVSGADKDFKARRGIFVLSTQDQATLKLASSFIKPFYKNKDVRPYYLEKQGTEGILYITGQEDVDKLQLAGILDHLMPFRERLSQRREVLKGLRPWYALQWPRQTHLFEEAKIIAPQRAHHNLFAYCAEPVYGSADLYYISPSKRGEDRETPTTQSWTLEDLTLYLNTKVLYYWLYYRGKRKGDLLELYATPLKKIPLPLPLKSDHHLKALKEGRIMAHRDSYDQLVYAHLGLSTGAIQTIESHYRTHVLRK